MARRYVLDSAFLAQGWVRDAVVTVSELGLVTGIGFEPSSGETPPSGETPSSGETQRIGGIVVPGMPNAHSHAFQRAMSGTAEYRSSVKDSFWTWRQAMYALANRLEPEELEIIATQLFVEMLKSGYTSVAEFHYLHRHRNAAPYLRENALWDAIRGAAARAGIGLTFLPTLYQTGDFDGAPLQQAQARFEMATDEFLRAVADCVKNTPRDGAGVLRSGAAFHSLRAVPYQTLCDAALGLRDIDATMPVHIHVAEQTAEVQACKRETGRRPIELLLQSGLLTRHWCLVHATHATPEELAGIVANAATVCVSISTEANLGDGSFDTRRFLGADGRLCIGSDSQSTVSPAEELRWLEYQQRLRLRRRAVLATAAESHVGTRLWRDAAIHGAQALGQPVGAIAVGRRADWLVLDHEHPSLAGAAAEGALDHLIFAGAQAAIRDVMVAGRWVVKDRLHAAEQDSQERFADLMSRLSAS